MNPIDRLKILINSSTPIVVMETVEEMRALTLVRGACSDLSLALFEWTIADGLVRSGGAAMPPLSQSRAPLSASADTIPSPRTAMYNTLDPVQALANLETMTIEAVFVLKDFHRHMDNPVVVRRLRDVGQKTLRQSRNSDPNRTRHRNAARVGQPRRVSRSSAARSRPLARDHPRNLHAHGWHSHFETSRNSMPPE